jgi:hypothetical protein
MTRLQAEQEKREARRTSKYCTRTTLRAVEYANCHFKPKQVIAYKLSTQELRLQFSQPGEAGRHRRLSGP